MTSARTDEQKPLRLWPGVAAVVTQWVLILGVSRLLPPEASIFAILGAYICALAVVVWWLFFSRAPWVERVGVVALMVAAVAVTKMLVHPSVANGSMGQMVPVYSIPVLCVGLVASLAATRGRSRAARRAALAAGVVLACSTLLPLRTFGISGTGRPDLHWRWTQTPEERLLAQGEEVAGPVPAPTAAPTAAPVAAPASVSPAEKAAAMSPPPEPEPPAIWPGFRGPDRDGVVRGVRVETDWSKSPPALMWRRPVGPAWSSFAVRGRLAYTQEQRGAQEDVSSYDLASGKLVWRHRDTARFWESNAGPGPRSTPAVSNGRVYTLGATGVLNALDATTGARLWSRNAASDTGAPTPGWGFTGSPLVVDDVVVVAASGRLAGYDAASGAPRWQLKTGGGSYSSPQLMNIGGVRQVVMLTSIGATAVAPADGTRLWDHAWPGVTILQPARTADGDLLMTVGDMMGGVGTRRIAVTRGPAGWAAQERWTSTVFKPYFNDYVVHQGHAFGFDGSILACIDLNDGQRKWKGGRYGHGQMVLLPEQDLLLVVSEDGDLALVGATPDGFKEVARAPAIQGKTWNHPVLAGDVLLVRNGEEMAAFRLSRAGS
jgi:outer membrane protein assembly factor BamB